MKKKAPRGYPTAGVVTRLQQAQANKSRRSAAVIASNALRELKALAPRMPDIPDADARKLALRMYYLELSKGVLLNVKLCPGFKIGLRRLVQGAMLHICTNDQCNSLRNSGEMG